MTSFGGEVTSSALCRKRHVKDPCGVRQRYFTDKINGRFSLLRCSVSLLVFARERDLMNESGMIETQIETHYRWEMVAMRGTLCTIPPRNSNQYPITVTVIILKQFYPFTVVLLGVLIEILFAFVLYTQHVFMLMHFHSRNMISREYWLIRWHTQCILRAVLKCRWKGCHTKILINI
jgi:hypothetical protein